MKKLASFLLILFVFLLNACGPHKTALQMVPGKESIYNHPSVAVITKQMDAEPKNAALYYKRAMALRQLQEDSLALIDLHTAVSMDSSKAPYFSAIGEMLFEHKDMEGSVQWFKKAIAINAKDPVAHLKFAKMLMFISDNQQAFKEINTVLRQDPYNAEAYFLKGMVYKNLNDTAKALSSFQTSVQVDPGYQPSILQLALIYAVKKDPIALHYFDNAFAADTTQMVALHGKAMFYQDNGQLEKAKLEYKNCVLHDPQYADAFFNMGWILMQQDSLDKAIKQFNMVTKIEPDNAEAYYNRGVCFELLKRKSEALADYKQALEFADEYKEAAAGVKRLSAQ